MPVLTSAIARGKTDAEQRDRLGTREEGTQGIDLDQRHVAVQDEHALAAAEVGYRLLQRMAGAELWRLLHPEDVVALGEGRGHPLAAVAVDDHGARRRQCGGGIEDVGQQRPTGEGVQDLRQGRLHAGTLTRGEDHDAELHGGFSSSSG